MNCKLITVCSRTDEYGYQMLAKSAHRFGWDLVTIQTEWKGFGTKLIKTYEFLKLNPDITHIFFCDAYDVCVLGTMEEALFNIADHNKIILSGERGCWPIPDWSKYYDNLLDHRFNYVNSGLYFAPTDQFCALLEYDIVEFADDDQQYMTRNYLFNQFFEIGLDQNCDVFQSYSFIEDGDYAYDNGRLKNNLTNTTPVFVHGNGKQDLTPIYNLL